MSSYALLNDDVLKHALSFLVPTEYVAWFRADRRLDDRCRSFLCDQRRTYNTDMQRNKIRRFVLKRYARVSKRRYFAALSFNRGYHEPVVPYDVLWDYRLLFEEHVRKTKALLRRHAELKKEHKTLVSMGAVGDATCVRGSTFRTTFRYC